MFSSWGIELENGLIRVKVSRVFLVAEIWNLAIKFVSESPTR